MEEKIERLVDKIYIYFKEKENRSYPLMLSKDLIKEELERLMTDNNRHYLLDESQGEIHGLCGYFIIEEEKYLQTTILLSFDRNRMFVKKVLEYFMEKYQGYSIIIGLEAENLFLKDELKKASFKIVDDLYSSSIKLKKDYFKRHIDVKKINLSQWDDYKELHHKYFGKGYWTFDRIKEDFENWLVLSIEKNNLIRAYIFIRINPRGKSSEIYGIYGDEKDERVKLIEHSLAILRDRELLYYFIEDYDEMEAIRKLAFEIHGHYQAFEYKNN